MKNKMKKVARGMSILMGVTLSFFLSLIGNLMSRHFTVQGFLISFVVSLVISLIIGFVVPIKKINDSLGQKLGLEEHSLKTHFFETLISDVIYTPIITVVMVLLAYMRATKMGGDVKLAPMLISSLIVSMIAGYILIFIFMPIYMKFLLKKNGINMDR